MQVGLCLCCSQAPEDSFSRIEAPKKLDEAYLFLQLKKMKGTSRVKIHQGIVCAALNLISILPFLNGILSKMKKNKKFKIQ